jgi:GGDEF domain-containing protein
MHQDLILSNQKLALDAVTDPLTGLNNKRFFDLGKLWATGV